MNPSHSLPRPVRISLPARLANIDAVRWAQSGLLPAGTGNAGTTGTKALFQRFDLATRKLARSVVPLRLQPLPGTDLAAVIRGNLPEGNAAALPLLVFCGLETLTGGEVIRTPPLLAYRLEAFLDIDHAQQTVWLVVDAAAPEADTGSTAHAALLAALHAEGHREVVGVAGAAAEGDVTAWTHDADFATHAQRVASIRNEASGGALQGANLSIGLSRPTQACPFDIYRACVAANPSPYGYVLQEGDFALVGSSPLAFLQLDAGKVHLETDAGTRPVTGDPAADNAAALALLNTQKDAAEHQIVVDAETQALEPISEGGRVKAVVSRQVRRFSHVMHLYSAFESQLAAGLDVVDALLALAPAAAVSGYPKKDALALARRLEQVERGPYGGVIGIVRSRHDADFAVVIRSLWLQHGVASLRVGGKVVADSDPRTEYEEAISKSRFLINAVARAEAAAPLNPLKN